jgi:hypothetical protein
MSLAAAVRVASVSPFGAGELNEAEVDFVFAVEAVFVLVVKLLDLHGADGALRLALLALHVAVDDFLFLLAAEFADRGAAGAEVGEEFGAVVVELLALHAGDLGVDDGAGDLLFLVLAKFFDDEDAVDEVLDNAVLKSLDFGVILLLVADGLALESGEERGDFAADVGDGDDLVLGDGDDAVGVAEIQVVARGRGGRLRAKTNGGQRGGESGGETAAERHGVGKLFRKVRISRKRRRGLGAVNLGNRVPTCTQSSRRPLFRRHFSRLDSVSTETRAFCSARMRISVTRRRALTSSANLPKRSRRSDSICLRAARESARASLR